LLATTYAPDEITYAWLGAIERVEKDEKDPTVRYVWGKATDPSVDSDEQIVDAAFAKSAMPEWYDDGKMANVRQMHSTNLYPAGKGVLLESRPDGEWVRTKVVQADAVKLVDEGVYTGYSVGIAHPRIIRDNKARGGRIVGGKIVEISLVDRPANPMAKFMALGSDGIGAKLAFIGKIVGQKVAVVDPGYVEEPAAEPEPASKSLRRGRRVTLTTTDGEEITGIVAVKTAMAVRLDTRLWDAARSERNVALSDVASVVVKAAKDPNVGGGVDRTKIPSKDFVFPEDKPDGGFPIVKPGDVDDAVHSWGRYTGSRSFADFKSRLTSIANRKGPTFAAQLPSNWGDDGDATKVSEAMKAAGITHSHEHEDPDNPGTLHTHPHTHAWNHGDHSQSHAHNHPQTEESVADATQADTADATKVAAEGEAPDCSTCKGSGKIMEGNRSCPDCNGTGKKAPDAAADKSAGVDIAQCDKCKGSGLFGEADAKCDKCGGTGKAAAMKADDGAPVGSDVPTSLPKAAKKSKKTFAPQATATDGTPVVDAGGTGPGSEPAPAVAPPAPKAKKAKKVAKTKKLAKSLKGSPDMDDVAWQIKRAHDYTCAAYDPADVAEFYPTIEKNGVAEAVGPGALKAIFAMLVQEVKEDQGSGEYAENIKWLSKAYDAIVNHLDAEDVDTDGGNGNGNGGANLDDIMLAARSELHAAFKVANMAMDEANTSVLPKPSDTITPGQFKRPFITAGQQQEVATEHSADVTPDTHPISASDFTRGPITAGQQRTLTQKLADLHDALAAWKPDLCLMDASGSNAFDRQPAASFDRTNRFQKLVNDNQDARPQRAVMPPTVKAPGEKVITLSLSQDDITKIVEEALAKEREPLLTKIDKLQGAYDELASQPDPNRSADRGVTGMSRKLQTATVTKAERKASRADARKAEKIEYLQSLAVSSDPAVRIRAQRKLTDQGIEVDY